MVSVHRRVVAVTELPNELARLFGQLGIDPKYAASRLTDHLSRIDYKGVTVTIHRPGSPEHTAAGLAPTVVLVRWWRRHQR